MKLLDSNIVIGAGNSGTQALQSLLAGEPAAVSAITKVEVLGYHKLTAEQKAEFEVFFDGVWVIRAADAIIEKAIELRQIRRMSLGDSLIAATALVHGLPLITRNTADFRGVDGLEVIHPDRQDPGAPDPGG